AVHSVIVSRAVVTRNARWPYPINLDDHCHCSVTVSYGAGRVSRDPARMGAARCEPSFCVANRCRDAIPDEVSDARSATGLHIDFFQRKEKPSENGKSALSDSNLLWERLAPPAAYLSFSLGCILLYISGYITGKNLQLM